MQEQKQVSVFGPSSIEKNGWIDMEAITLGKLLADNGYIQCNGGYTGVMESAAKGGFEAGGKVRGVLISTFSNEGNQYLTEKEKKDVWERNKDLMKGPTPRILFSPRESVGTIWELASATAKSLFLGPPIIMIVQDGDKVFEAIRYLWGEKNIKNIVVVNSAEAAVARLCEFTAG
ncbi:MAG: hypothetical protein V1860_02225 [bacterium]